MKSYPDGTVALTIGFSPCPNDTFIFDALVNGRIDTGKLRFEPFLDDVEALNRMALDRTLDVSKVSIRAFGDCSDQYQLLNAGSALGFGVGPLLVKLPETQSISSVAIPGVHTTAAFLFDLFYHDVKDKREFLFSDIEDAVLSGRVDAGVIIHENRFTYQSRGLVAEADLGALWETRFDCPIPLGGIGILRSLDQSIRVQVDRLVKSSLEHAWNKPADSEAFIAEHAQAMDPEVRRRHVELYVNEYSLDLGEKGRAAIRFFLDKAIGSGDGVKGLDESLFV
jgi:1,4-dihydroxy-6-naphthoate synthase